MAEQGNSTQDKGNSKQEEGKEEMNDTERRLFWIAAGILAAAYIYCTW
jgi:hypothetical protein